VDRVTELRGEGRWAEALLALGRGRILHAEFLATRAWNVN